MKLILGTPDHFICCFIRRVSFCSAVSHWSMIVSVCYPLHGNTKLQTLFNVVIGMLKIN
jgi:hypothetical protein